MTEDNDSEAMYLDEEDELYGWGILDVRLNEFVGRVEAGKYGNSPQVFSDEGEAIALYKEMCAAEGEQQDQLRIVRVHLDNRVGEEAVEQVDELFSE